MDASKSKAFAETERDGALGNGETQQRASSVPWLASKDMVCKIAYSEPSQGGPRWACANRATELVQLLAVSVWLLYIRFQGASPGAFAALLAIAASVAQVIRSRSKASGYEKVGEHLWPDALPSSDSGASPGLPEPTPNHQQKEFPFEESITRLAGAAELGTEPLIYVRRRDVAEVVDALMNHARTPGGLSVTSPALARLSIVRRSRRSDARGRRSACSPEFRVSEGERTPAADHKHSPPRVFLGRGSARRSASASPPIRMATDGVRALFKDNSVPCAASPSTIIRRSEPCCPPPIAVSTCIEADDGATINRRRARGERQGEQRKWRQRTRSPSPVTSSSRRTPVALARNNPLITSPAATSPAATESSICPTSEKITCVSRSPGGVAVKGAAFADFWSSGWG